MTDPVLMERMDQGVALLRFNRPDKHNAFDQSLRDALVAALGTCEDDPSVRTVVLTGNARAFVAGADLSEVAHADAAKMASARLHHVWDRLDRFAKPLLMAVQGYALGAGCELALHADILIVAQDATLGQPEIRVGIQPGAGGISRMIGRIGWTRTMLLTMTGETIDGSRAAAWGLAAEALPKDDVLPRTLALASQIASLPSARVRDIKRIGRQAFELPLTASLEAERLAYWQSFGTPDQREGMSAFLEKRRPAFNRDPAS